MVIPEFRHIKLNDKLSLSSKGKRVYKKRTLNLPASICVDKPIMTSGTQKSVPFSIHSGKREFH